MNSDLQQNLPPHILIFPFPVQGHLNSMLNLAHLLCLSNCHVTFITSDFNHRRNNFLSTASARYPGFRFHTLPDGLPDDHSRAGKKVLELVDSITNVMIPHLKKMMVEENFMAADGRRPVTCFIADGLLSFAADFAEENGLPLVYFRTATASYFWALFRYPNLVEAQDIPFREKSIDGLVRSVPGMESFLRRRDLPAFYRVDNVNEPILKYLIDATTQIVRAQAVIFNTCEDLEGPIVAEMQNHIPRTYSIGPIHEQLKSRLIEKKEEASIVSASLWAEDPSCIDWLNMKPEKSVIYVSFGSITMVTREQVLEFWHGLLNSDKKFLWVMRPDSIARKDGNDEALSELLERSKGNCLLVEWAPQEKVLNHPAVGAFLTHSGWNSILESIAAGVPMICWPYFADQTINSRFVSEVWKIGLDIKDTCDRLIVEKAVREVMEMRREEFLERAGEMAKVVKKGVSKGGSSYGQLDGLIEYIKSLVI